FSTSSNHVSSSPSPPSVFSEFISFSNCVAKGHRLHFGNLLRKDVVTVQSARRSTVTLFPFTSALCLRSVAIL
uniref:Uncharacterized protein n=2 Tax=Brassica oleracea TaxID=3712 RepID=A0A0D2ZS21_BRAOL